jgi:hypothetical protein
MDPGHYVAVHQSSARVELGVSRVIGPVVGPISYVFTRTVTELVIRLI